MEPDYFALAGPMTKLTELQASIVRDYSADASELGHAVQQLLISPGDAFGMGLSERQMAERNTRPATEILRRAVQLDSGELGASREVQNRIVGSCRHYAVLTTAMLRANRVPARARCGFAAYFVPNKYVDHWITEYWCVNEKRWVRMDSEVLGLDILERPDDLGVGHFMSAGEAWVQIRKGVCDAIDFGVTGTENWGVGEIRGNLMRDVAALMKIEMLPWDEWGSMTASYNGETGSEFDQLMDEAADACAGGNRSSIDQIYFQLAIPDELIN